MTLDARATRGEQVWEGALRCGCGRVFPVISGIPRVLPTDLAASLVEEHGGFFQRHPDLHPATSTERTTSSRTLHAFGDEWRRFPELLAVHEQIFSWYFEGPQEIHWQGLRVLDGGCGMGRWLHFARRAGAQVVGMDLSPAVDVAAARDGDAADFVQADLRWPPFPAAAFDLVYSLGVVHHLEDAQEGVRALARLVRPGGELRLYVYRSLADDPWPWRLLLSGVTLLRRITTRLPFWMTHLLSWMVSALITLIILVPRRCLRWSRWGDRLTRQLPLAQYTDVPFRMLVAEQFDRLCAPIEGRYRRQEVADWFAAAGLETRAILPGLGWRAVGVRPPA